MSTTIIKSLSELLVGINKKKPTMFAGIGIIVYTDINSLPISPLKNSISPFSLPKSGYHEIESCLLEISTFDNNFHDGFHLIDARFQLTHLSQYFAAPIIDSPKVEFEFGSRYRAAFYGSFIQSIVACGVLSNAHRPTIFQEGNKINPYEWLSR